MKDRKRWQAALLAGAMILALAACGGTKEETPPSDAPASAQPSPSGDGGLVVCVSGEPRSLDPTLSRPSDSATVLSHLFEGLMKWADSGEADDNGLGRAELTYGQAEGYDRTENADGTVTYTFRLRSDAKWSDGKSVTAGDFVYAWQRLVDPRNGAGYSDMLACVVNAEEIMAGTKEPGELAVQAVDDHTFAVTVHDVPYFTQLCALPVTFPVRQDVVEENPGQWTYDPETYVSNGMYTLSAWTHSGSIVLVPNEHYYDPAAQAVPSLTFRLMEDESVIRSAVEAGTVDFALGAPADQTAQLLADGSLGVADYLGAYFLSFQTQKAPFDDPRVRQAFTLAVDRGELVEKTVRGGQTPAGGYVPFGVADFSGGDFRAVGGDYYDPSSGAYEDNCETARRLLAEAGYPGGIGFPEVEYLYNTGGTDDLHKAVAQALQAMWQENLGVTVTLKGQEWSGFLESRRNGEYHIARNSWSADYNDPMSFLELWTAEGGDNEARYANADYDALIRDAATTPSPTRRIELLHQAEALLIGRDFVLCPLYFYTRTYQTSGELDGVYYTPLGYFFFNAATKH